MNQKPSTSAHWAETQATARIYTNPELREQLKEELLASDRGGAPGEWSPRKAELLAHDYRQSGGGYTFAKRGSAPLQSPDWSGNIDAPPGNDSRLPQPAWTDYASPTRPAADDQKRDETRSE